MGDGTINVGVGLLSTFKRLQEREHHAPDERVRGDRSRVLGHIDRRPPRCRRRADACRWAARSVRRSGPRALVVGDAAGTINPFNGEGIDYAYETGRMAADVLSRGADHRRRLGRCSATRDLLDDEYGLYFKVARLFVRSHRPARADARAHPRRHAVAARSWSGCCASWPTCCAPTSSAPPKPPTKPPPRFAGLPRLLVLVSRHFGGRGGRGVDDLLDHGGVVGQTREQRSRRRRERAPHRVAAWRGRTRRTCARRSSSPSRSRWRGVDAKCRPTSGPTTGTVIGRPAPAMASRRPSPRSRSRVSQLFVRRGLEKRQRPRGPRPSPVGSPTGCRLGRRARAARALP